jgi:hypothetical protein
VQSERRHALIVGSISVLLGQVLLGLLSSLSRAGADGVRADGIGLLSADSVGYLDLAGSSSWLSETPWNRVLYIALLRLGGALGDATTFVVVLQVIALVVAATLAHRSASEVAGRMAGAFAAAVVAINPLTAQWVRFVLTETLFITLALAALWAAIRVIRQGISPVTTAPLLTVTLLATLLRPNGIMLLGGAATLIVLQLPRRLRAPGLIGVGAVVIVGLASGLDAAGQPAERSLTAQLHAGVVIEGTEHVVVTIPMPRPEDAEDESISAGVRYALRNPFAVTRLASARVAMEVIQVRRHYPRLVNVTIGLAMTMLLGSAALGARGDRVRALRRGVLVLGAPVLLLVGATFATPEGRYGWGALVLLAPLAGVGAARVAQHVVPRRLRRQSAEGPGTAR